MKETREGTEKEWYWWLVVGGGIGGNLLARWISLVWDGRRQLWFSDAAAIDCSG